MIKMILHNKKSNKILIIFLCIIVQLIIITNSLVSYAQEKNVKTNIWGQEVEVYYQYLEALKNEDMVSVKSHLSQRAIENIPRWGQEQIVIKLMKNLTPDNIKIEKVLKQDNKAQIYTRADTLTGKASGIIEMIIENGKWKILNENWQVDIELNQKKRD